MNDLLSIIREENLNVYRHSVQRLNEDVNQESEIAQNYRGRLIYELLQNADDAIGSVSSPLDVVRFVVTESELWMANSGKPLDEKDVRGLSGISASTKIGQEGKRRASIGHKGMGFKSILEISDVPEVYSTDYAFRFRLDDALCAVRLLADEGYITDTIKRAPIMRFPWPVDAMPTEWKRMHANGMTTAFRFPFHPAVTQEQKARLIDTLRSLPITTILFLKHLERIEIEIRWPEPVIIAWTIRRQRLENGVWLDVTSLCETGIHRITIASDEGDIETFVVAHDANIQIAGHQGGLNAVAWEGIEYTEVSVATWLHEGCPSPLPSEWKKFHVFLPTGEASPYHLLVNGAFNSSLSRQEIRVEQDAANYNTFLIQQAARLVRDGLFPHLLATGLSAVDCVKLLDRGNVPSTSGASSAFYAEMKAALAHHQWLPNEQGSPISIGELAIPSLVDNPHVGRQFRDLLPRDAALKAASFPVSALCGSDIGKILVDHGACHVSPEDAAALLAHADPSRVQLREHPSGKLFIDPVLEVLEALWIGFDSTRRERLARAVRCHALFPVDITEDDTAARVPTDTVTCFYPPRAWKGTLPLEGMQLLLQDICWGDLTPQERNILLKQQMVAWTALFDLKEFKFPEVMRASVLPSLSLDGNLTHEREHDETLQERIAAICQLAGRTPNPNAPLPYERLGANRALFNLSRLELPCRSETPGALRWVPAYRVYFGKDWVAEQSVERIIERAQENGISNLPSFDFLVSPDFFAGRLDRYRHLRRAVAEEPTTTDDEVELDEDDEVALDDDDRHRWMQFFRWLGVNASLRPIHFHDVEDRGQGWLTTQDLRRPTAKAFQQVPPGIWRQYLLEMRQALQEAENGQQTQTIPYFYRLHILEHLELLLGIAERDDTATIGQALYEHLALNWQTLESFSRAQIARVPCGQEPTKRSKPPRARTEELIDTGIDFWLYRLRTAGFCPTHHGPRCVTHVWWPSKEAQRRFARRSQTETPSFLIPVLDAPLGQKGNKARSFAQALGMREELSPSTFTLDDAQIVLRRLQQLYEHKCSRAETIHQDLRDVIRPAYRHVIELLVGGDRSRYNATASTKDLMEAPLLAQNGSETYRFLKARDLFYVDRRDTRDRLQDDASIWTFVLEAYPAARAPLTQLFGVQVLEEALCWEPIAGDQVLDTDREQEFREWLRDLAPYLLARVGVDHIDDQIVRRDIRGLRTLIERIEPVTHLELRCTLGDKKIGVNRSNRDTYVCMEGNEVRCAFLVWGETAVPCDPRYAEALAVAFCDVLGINYFESFLALIQARTNDERDRLLRRAGAPRDIAERRAMLFGDVQVSDAHPPIVETYDEDIKTVEPPTTVKHNDSSNDAGESQQDQDSRVRLYNPADLIVDGTPSLALGTEAADDSPVERMKDYHLAVSSVAHRTGGYGGHTNLTALDDLGMSIILTYELNRLHHAGNTTATVFDVSIEMPQPDALVFDVTTPENIERARGFSPRFAAVLQQLAREGLSVDWPGFDVLTLSTDAAMCFDRLIELKSSGVASRLLELTWNEWKTAQSSTLREHFYVYLVGNLRADIPGSIPFIRAYRNPFEQLQASVSTQRSLQRKVKLSTTDFREAEHLDLIVHTNSEEAVSPS
ncbi:MAG: sacsin N-terminal ATP-binding-like domain-containing protein [Armatimonadota bacterium]